MPLFKIKNNSLLLTLLAIALFASGAHAGQKDSTPPTVPSNPSVGAVTCSQINLTWSASIDTAANGESASGVKGYYIYRDGSPSPLTFVTTTTTSDSGLAGNTTHSYQVSAIDNSNNVSTLSVAVYATTPACPDTIQPTVPANLSASAVDCGQVSLAWEPSSDPSDPNQQVSGVKGYFIYRDGSPTPLKFVTATTTSDTGLTGNTTHSYQVSAVDNNNNASTLSVAAFATTPPCSDTISPTVPANLSASAVDCGQVSLAWEASSDPSDPNQQASGVKGYNVYRGGVLLKFVTGTATSDLGLAGTAQYSYQISSLDFAGNESALSGVVPVTTPPCLPDAPTGLNGNAANCRRAEISWNMPANVGSGFASFNVYRDGNLVGQVTVASLSENGLAPGTSYTYWVTTMDTWGRESAPSGGFTLAVPNCFAVSASNLRITRSGKLAVLQWDGTSNALYQAQSALGFFGPWVPVDAPTTEFSVTNLAVEASAIYRIALFTNTPGYLASFEMNNKDKAAPSAPLNFSISVVSDTEAQLSWEPVSDNGTVDDFGQTYTSGLDRYIVYRDGVFLKNEPPEATGSSDTSAEADAQYVYSVASIDKAGNQSEKISQSVLMRKQCSYSLAPTSATIPASGGNGSASMTVGNGCSWAAQTTTPWIHPAGSGNGNGMITYSVDANDGPTARSGTINAGTKSYTITQVAPSCSYSLSPTSFSHGNGVEGGSFWVTAPAGCSWSASTAYSWIHTSSSGSGSASVNYALDGNGSPSSRSGTISVGGQTFTVFQAGLSCSYSLSPTSFGHGAGGEFGSFTVSAPAGCSWTASSGDGWIHPSGAGSGNGTVNYTVDANGSTARSGTITAGGQTFTVSQAGISCNYSLNPTSSSHGAGAEGGGFTVSAPAGCSWTASSGDGWIHPSGAGSGNGTVNYTVDANGSASRSGSIIAGGQTFTISQAGVTCNYSLNPTSLSHGAGAEGGSFSVSAPAGCSWTASSADGWIHPNGAGNGNGTVNYTVDANGSIASRSGTITAGGQIFSISQAGASCIYSLNPTSSGHGAGGEGGSFSVTSAAGCSWTASSSDGWIHPNGAGNGNGTVNYSVDANGSISSRSGTIIAGGQTFTVSQAGLTCTYFLNPTSFSHGAGAEGGSFSINASAGCGWFASTGDGWIHTGSSGSGNGTVSYTVDANLGSAARSGSITAGGQTFTVSQAAPVCNYSLSAASASFGSSAGSSTVGVTAGLGCSWVATSSASWITITSGSVGTGNGTVGYSVDSNGSASSRSGTMTIAGQTFTVTQSGSGSVPGTYAWAKDLRGTGVNDTAHVNGVAVDNQGFTIVVGSFSGTINFGGTSLTSAGGVDVFVAKYSSAGVLQWAKRFGDNYDQTAYSAKVDSGNNIILVGSFAGTVNFGGSLLSEVPTPSFYYSQTDIFVAKLNASGGHVWSRSFGSSGPESAYGVTVDGSDNVIFTGNYSIPPTTAQLDFGGGALGNSGAQDMFVTKLAADGSYRWSVHHGNTDGTYSYAVYANGISADRNGDVAVVGYFSGGTIDLGGGNRVSAGNADVFLAKYSGTTGGHLWSKTMGSGGSEVGKGVTTDANNNVIITGGFNGTVDFGGAQVTAPQATGIFVAKYSAAGGFVWAKGFGGNYFAQDIGYGVATDASGNIGLTGTVQGSYVDFGGGPLYSDGTLNVFVAKLSANGDYVWAKRLKSGATLNYGCATAFDSSGNLVSGGFFGGTMDFGGGPVTANVSSEDGFLIKYGP